MAGLPPINPLPVTHRIPSWTGQFVRSHWIRTSCVPIKLLVSGRLFIDAVSETINNGRRRDSLQLAIGWRHFVTSRQFSNSLIHNGANFIDGINTSSMHMLSLKCLQLFVSWLDYVSSRKAVQTSSVNRRQRQTVVRHNLQAQNSPIILRNIRRLSSVRLLANYRSDLRENLYQRCVGGQWGTGYYFFGGGAEM